MWITFLRHHVHELQTFKYGPFLWPTQYIAMRLTWRHSTRCPGANIIEEIHGVITSWWKGE